MLSKRLCKHSFLNIRRAERSSATSVRTRATAEHPYVHVRGGRGRDCANVFCCARLSFIDLLCEYIVHCSLTAVQTKFLNVNGFANVFCCARAQRPYVRLRGGRGVCVRLSFIDLLFLRFLDFAFARPSLPMACAVNHQCCSATCSRKNTTHSQFQNSSNLQQGAA